MYGFCMVFCAPKIWNVTLLCRKFTQSILHVMSAKKIMSEKNEKPSESEPENGAKKIKEKRAKLNKEIEELQEKLKKQKIIT